jgi:hypothetical protein
MNKEKVMKKLLIAAALVALAGCKSPGLSGVEETTLIETPDGAIIVDTFTATAMVAAIDSAKRKVTLVSPDGRKTTYKAVPEVVNFGQIRAGDRVKVVLTEEAAVSIGRGAAPSAMVGSGVALAPVGAKPAGVLVDTMQVTARVAAVDAKTRKVTFELPDGRKTVKVGKQVDLATVMPGDNVTVQISEGLTLAVEKQ